MKVLSLVLRQLHFPDPMPGRMLEQGFLRSHHSMRSYAAYAAVGNPRASSRTSFLRENLLDAGGQSKG